MPIRAAVLPAPRRPLEIWRLDDPDLEPGSVLLETIASEVCGTDVHLRDGRLSGVPYPLLMGHVSVGRILESRGVERDAMGAALSTGDVVTFLDVHEVCGRCYHCAVTYQPNRCPSRRVYGITYGALEGPLGGWAERIYLKPGVRIVKLPEALSADDVIGGGCGLFTGFAAVERSALAMGDTVLVQGAGPVGLAVAGFASLRGAGRVLMIGAPRARLALAARFGADTTFDLGTTTAAERSAALEELTSGRGADVVIEATGNPAAIREGLGLVRDGGTYVVAGHYTDAGETPINPHTDLNRKHVEVRAQWGTEFRHVARALVVYARHRDRLPFVDVIGGRYGLADADRALADVEALRVTKAIMDPEL
jgi:L-iditol 2-dehydrogenase